MYANDFRNRLLPKAMPTIFPSMEGSSRNFLEMHNYSGHLESSSDIISVAPDEINIKEPPRQIQMLENVLLTEPLMVAVPREATPSPKDLLSPNSTQTAVSLISNTPRKEKLRLAIRKLRNENDRLKAKNKKLTQGLNELN